MRELLQEIEAESSGLLSITDVVLREIEHRDPNAPVGCVAEELEAWRAGELHVLPTALERLADHLHRQAVSSPRQMVMLAGGAA